MVSFNNTVIARVVAGLYDLQLGNENMTWVLDQVNAGTSVADLLQMAYDNDFAGKSAADVATIFVANLGMNAAHGLSAAQIDLVESIVATNLTAGGAGNEGATLVMLANLYSTFTTDPALGASVRAFNAQITAAVNYAEIDDSVTVPVHPPEEALNFSIGTEDVAGLDAMRLTGDTDVRIDFTNDAQQITGLDLDGDGLIEFNGMERTPSYLNANVATIGANHSGFEIIDAYSRNPLDHTDTANNFTGDIYFDGSSFAGAEGDGTKTDGNIFLGGLGEDSAFGGVGNDFLAGGSIGQGEFDGVGDYLSGGRNADFFFAEFSQLDLVDGGTTLYVDGGNTSDDQPAGVVQSDQDNDWILIEASDDDEPVVVSLEEELSPVFDDDNDITTRSGEEMDIDDVENLDASGNLYGFLDDFTDADGNQLRVGDRATDARYEGGANDGSTNYGIGSSAQLDISGSEVANIIIAGYDNDYVAGNEGNDLLFGGNLQFLFETVADSVTNLNLANVTLDGLDDLWGGAGNDGLAFEADGGIIDGGDGDAAGTDTLWVTNYSLGTNDAAASTTDGVLRFDLGSQYEVAGQDAEGEVGFLGYGGAERAGTADQTNYSGTTSNKAVTVAGIEIVDASGLSTGVRGLDYFSAGSNSPDVSFNNRQNFAGYNGDLDLRGNLNTDNQLYAGAGNDVLEGRGGSSAAAESATAYDNTLMGGAGDDDFYFSIDGDAGMDETNVLRRKVDANADGYWDGSDAKGTTGTWGQDFGLDETVTENATFLEVDFRSTNFSDPNVLLTSFSIKIGGQVFAVADTASLDVQDAEELAGIVNDAFQAIDEDVTVTANGNVLVVTDAQGRDISDTVPEGYLVSFAFGNAGAESFAEFKTEPPSVSQDRLIFKSYEDRSDNEGVDDDSITGSTISLGEDAYAEDLVVSFAADGTRIAEDQNYVITFTNLTTQDKVTVTVNGVKYELTVGVDVNGTQIDGEDTVETDLAVIQTNFLARLAGFINSFMDDDTAAGQVAAASTATTLTLTQVAYSDGEETVFMSTPTVTLVNGSGGEKATAAVDNDAQTEVFLYQFDGRDNNLNADNVLFWGQENINRSTLETAPNAGAGSSDDNPELVGHEAVVIDGGFGPGDDDIDGIAQNKATDRDFVADTTFEEENFAVHGDDYLIGGNGDDTISGMTGDDRVRGSLGNDELDGGKDWYAVKEQGDKTYALEYLNAFEAAERDADGDVLDIQLIWQTEDGVNLIVPTDESPSEEYEAYFDDTLIYHQADFTAGVTRFTITLNDYIGLGEDIEFDNGGAGTVGVDANGDGTVEVDNVSTFTNFENIRTVSGIGFAVAGTDGGQGRDTLNVMELSDDSDVGVMYDLTGDATAGQVTLLEDLDDDDEVDNLRVVIRVDGVENVIFGDGDDVLLIDETEAAKDNEVTGDLGDDVVVYMNDYDGDMDAEPTVTINVGPAHGPALDAGTDTVEMTEGRVGEVVATDTLHGVEVIDLEDNTAAGIREDDTLNVEALSGGASVSYVTGEIFSDTDGDLDFEDGVLQLTVDGLEQIEFVVADGKDAVIVASSDIMSLNLRTDDDSVDLVINSHLNYDLLDERGDTPERMTIADLRAVDGGTDDTADELDIPEGYNFAQFNFQLGANTDTVDYSQADDSITAVLDVTSTEDTQYVMVDAGADDSFDVLDDFEGDRIDVLESVEQIVASLGESVMDFTAAEEDVNIDFEFDNSVDDTPDDGDVITSRIRIADGNGNELENISALIERYTFNDAFDPGIDTTDDATWNRIEGSDANEKVSYDGSENLPEQAGLDHRFTDDELNLRGGEGNTVSYFKLETSIVAEIDLTAYDAANPLGTGLVTANITFDDFDLDPEVAAATGTHTITSNTLDNEIAAGHLKIEASQDDADAIVFGPGSGIAYLIGSSTGVVDAGLVGDDPSVRLTGFEVLVDGPTDDVYTFDDIGLVDSDLDFIDNIADDRDTLQLLDLGEGIDFTDIDNDTISLEVINDEFAFDFDVLDISKADDENNLVLVGDTDLVRDDVGNGDGTDDDGDGLPDDADDLIVGDLSLIDTMEAFDGLWLTDTSVESDDTFVLDQTGADYVLQDSEANNANEYFNAIIGGIFELNFSLVTDTDLTISVIGDDGMILVGGGGDDDISGSGSDDLIAGGGGADDLDGGQSAEVREIELTGAMSNDASGDDIDVDFNGLFTVTITEGVEIPEGAGITQIGAALLAAITANLDDINLADPYGVPIASVELDGAILRFTFEAGTDVDDLDYIDIDGNGNGDTVSGEIAGAEDIVSDGSDGGNDIFVYTDASESTEADMDQIFNFTVNNGGNDDMIDLSGVGLEPHPLEVINGGSGYANFAAALADAADEMDFFDVNVFVASDGDDTWVFVALDSHDAAVDMVIELVGIDATGIDEDNFVGATAP